MELIRELLADGAPHAHHELYEISCVAHNRVGDLRKRLRREELERDVDVDPGLVSAWNPVLHWSDVDERTGETLHMYRLQPIWEFERERRSQTSAAPSPRCAVGEAESHVAGSAGPQSGGPGNAAGPAAPPELPVDVSEQLLLEREYEGLREIGEAAA